MDVEIFLKNNYHLPIDVLGPVTGSEKKELFEQADVFVFPTYYPPEGHPWVIIEAMAAKLPVVSTRHAAIPESVFHRRNGILVEKQDPDSIATALIELAKNTGLRTRMGEESRKLYEELFTEKSMVLNMSHAFSKILAA